MSRLRGWLVVALAAAAAIAWLLRPQGDARDGADAAALGLPPLERPHDDASRIELGRKLFFDRRLSFNGTMSCGMCHVPEEGFASNASRLAVGIEGRSLKRNAPTVLNVAWQQQLFHDGREPSLAAQVWSPLLHPDEMANPSAGHVLARIRALPDYAGRFERAFDGRGVSMDRLGEAIAAYERSLVAGDSRFDRWRFGNDAAALGSDARRGFDLFVGQARCVACHTVGEHGALFTDGRFHVTGAGAGRDEPRAVVVPLAPGVQTTLAPQQLDAFRTSDAADLGRFEITLDPADRQAFKTPSLRNVARTAPYMHDGSLATLADVIDFYDRGGGDVPGRSALLVPLALSPIQKRDLLAFLHALDSGQLPALVAAARHDQRP